jgi:hypothetical protein
MATLNDLRTAIAQLLSRPAISNLLQLNSNTRERAFECYVFALVLRAVAQAGGTVELRGTRSGQNPNPLVFRGGPGHLGSRAQDFCYARCALNGHEFEVHTDIIYTGTSGAAHEIDVSICDRSAADAVRLRTGSLPNTRGLRAAIECKFYDSQLGTTLGRTFVGLVVDCGQMVFKSFVTNGRSQGLAAYFSKSSRPEAFFEVSPVRGDSRDRLVRVIEQALRRWASVS